MGSSVFHGGLSTLLAISCLSFGNLFTFKIFFKTWFCMLVFGLLNGIILNPIILSILGPIEIQKYFDASTQTEIIIDIEADSKDAKEPKLVELAELGVRKT